jgi:hypothetical protein
MINEAQDALSACFDQLTRSLLAAVNSSEPVDASLLKKSFSRLDQAIENLPDYENEPLEKKLTSLNGSFDFDEMISELSQTLNILKSQRNEIAEKYTFIINDFLINK